MFCIGYIRARTTQVNYQLDPVTMETYMSCLSILKYYI